MVYFFTILDHNVKFSNVADSFYYRKKNPLEIFSVNLCNKKGERV